MTVDLRDCKPGQKVLLRNGTTAVYVAYRDALPADNPYVHSLEESMGELFSGHTHNGAYYTTRESEFDVVSILDAETKTSTSKNPTAMTVDLRTCQPGQALRLRDGQVACYVDCDPPPYNDDDFCHNVKLHHDYLSGHKHSGAYQNSMESPYDVVEILGSLQHNTSPTPSDTESTEQQPVESFSQESNRPVKLLVTLGLESTSVDAKVVQALSEVMSWYQSQPEATPEGCRATVEWFHSRYSV